MTTTAVELVDFADAVRAYERPLLLVALVVDALCVAVWLSFRSQRR
ncbi:hypothetical protein [Streptomyces griseoluteus]|nr:hypothetical protein [Streptomyces griseoluteus]